MYIAYFWHKFNLPCKKVIAAFFLLLLISPAYAQLQSSSFGRPGKNAKNLPNYDKKRIHYGFFMGINYARMYMARSQHFTDQISDIDLAAGQNPVVARVVPKTNPGFVLGFVFNLNLHDNFAFRVLPSVGFYERGIEYTFSNDSTVYQSLQSTFVETSFLMKYRSKRRNNHRFYVVGGVQPSIEASAKQEEPGEHTLRTSAMDLSIEYGFGMDVYFPLFKFSPELRFSHGLMNMVVDDNNIYSNPIDKLTTHTVTLFILFE